VDSINGNYIQGTAARKIEYDVYEENKVLKQKKQAKSDNKVKFRYVLYTLAIFASCFLLVYRYAIITDLNYRINDTYKKYNELRNENSRMAVEIGKEMSLSKIKEIAENRLGMQKPDRYQMVQIRVPKTDFTVVADSYKNTEKAGSGALAVLMDRVKEFVKLLY